MVFRNICIFVLWTKVASALAGLTLMLLVANLVNTNDRMTETLANGYSSERTQRELSNEYQHDRVWMVFKNICIFVLWTKVASALEGSRDGDLTSSHVARNSGG